MAGAASRHTSAAAAFDASRGIRSSSMPHHLCHAAPRHSSLPGQLVVVDSDTLDHSLAGCYHFPYSLPRQRREVLYIPMLHDPATDAPLHHSHWHGHHRRHQHHQHRPLTYSISCPSRLLKVHPSPTPQSSLNMMVSMRRVAEVAAHGTAEQLHAVVEEVLDEEQHVYGYQGVWDAVARTLPLWLTVLLLLLTRIPQLGIHDAFISTSPSFKISLGSLGTFSMSAALVLQLKDILTVPGINWKYETLYVPFLVPFVIASLLCIAINRKHMQGRWYGPLAVAWQKTMDTSAAMIGALLLSQLLAVGGQSSPAYILGYYLSAWLGRGYLVVAGLLGALGSFVSGSVLTGNMTFGAIQMVAAERLGLSVTGMLAVQTAGACAGKMLCISNILAGKVVLRELGDIAEGEFIRQTLWVSAVFLVVSQLLGLTFTLGGVWPDTYPL
eukprot:gene6159-6396_t